MESWEKIIDALDDATDLGVDKFIAQMLPISKEYFERLIVSAVELKLRIGTNNPNSKEMAENLRKLAKLNSRLSKMLMDSGYKDKVSEYISLFKGSQQAIDLYYSTIISSYSPSKELFQSILESNLATTTESLLNSGIDANYTEGIKKILRDVVTGNGDYTLLKSNLKEYILGNSQIKPRLQAYSGQVASDAVRQFQRNYFNAVSEDLDLKHYFYRGTAIRDTRDFCQKRHGRYFTKEEVQSWADSKWQGKAKGTNKITIFTYIGGYNCRHMLLPVSKTIYDAKKNG